MVLFSPLILWSSLSAISCVAGQLVRALPLADDLALVSNSAQDLQALLNALAAYCDFHNVQSQVFKADIVPSYQIFPSLMIFFDLVVKWLGHFLQRQR